MTSAPLSLTVHEARARAAALSVERYRVHLDVSADEVFTSVSEIDVVLRGSAPSPVDTHVEMRGATTCTVLLDDETVYDGPGPAEGRVALPGLTDRHRVVVRATCPTVTNGDGMHRFVDPADEEVYVSAYCAIDIASWVFGCFDQPDLKAPIALSVTAPQEWTVLANGSVESVAADGEGRRTWRFTETPPLPPYLVTMCAGPWASRTWEHAGVPFGWHARASLADALDRDLADLREITERCYDHYTALFTEPYPFDGYDQVFVPGLNWGAMESAGCVTFRDEMLPSSEPEPMERLERAEVIAHEMAHMWFGDLVTMRWWEDTWLNESFADYMGYRVAADALGRPEALVATALLRKPTGFRADERSSTHPVAPSAEDVVDVDTAAGNFDMITYAKGNACLQQLVTWLGPETFVAGSDAHLTRHRFANADLADYLDSLDAVSDRDVRGWARSWLQTTGYDTLVVERSDDGVPRLRREGSRPHRVAVAAYADTGEEAGRLLLDVGAEPVELTQFRDRAVLPNCGDETFASLRLDEHSTHVLERTPVVDPLARAVWWRHALDRCEHAEIGAPEVIDLVARRLPGEVDPILFDAVLERALGLVGSARVRATDLSAVSDRLASGLRTTLEQRPRHEITRSAVKGLLHVEGDAERLREWWDAGAVATPADPIDLDDRDRWTVVTRLVALTGAEALPRVEELWGEDRTQSGRLRALRARAAEPTREAKETAWGLLAAEDCANRDFQALMSGLFTPGQHDVFGPFLDRYLAAAPAIARARGQAYGAVVGHCCPLVSLPDDLANGFAPALSAAIEGRHGQVPTVLDRAWRDRRDDLERMLRVRAVPSDLG